MNPAENQEATMTMEENSQPPLSFSEDEFFSSIMKKLTSQVDQNDSREYTLKDLVFDGHDVDELKQASFYEKPVCGKCIPGDQLCYICLDCDISPHPHVYSLLCEGCFEKSNHQGHRLYILKDEGGSGSCDCGDTQFLKAEGFCSDHKSKPINIQELYEKFPQDLRLKFESISKERISNVVRIFDEKQLLTEVADDSMSELLDFWIECYSEVNRAFLPILWTTLRGQVESSQDPVSHDCEDLKAAKSISQEPHQCTCSLLGSFLRISNLVSKENQGKLKKVLIECFKDKDFLEYFALEFIKYFHYFFTQNYNTEPSEGTDVADDNSLLLSMYFSLYQKDHVLAKVLDSGYFENFLDLFKKVVDNSTRVSATTSKIMTEVQQILNFFLMPFHTSARRLVQDKKFMLEYLDVIMTFQMKFYYPDKLTTDLFDHEINYATLNETLVAEIFLCRSLRNSIKIIFELPHDEQNKALEGLLKHWYTNLQSAKAVLKNEDGESIQSFNPCLERLFCCVMINYMKDDISTNNLQAFLKKNLNCIDEVALTTIEGPLRTLGMIRYLHLIFNYKSGNIFNVYYYNENAIFESDVVTIQMMLLLLKPEEEVFGLLIKNFFSYSPEIQQFFKDPNEENYEKKKLTVIEDFLNFLVFLMTDEISLLDVQLKCKKDNHDQIKLNQRQKFVAKNLLVNILRGYYWTTSQEVTNILNRFLTDNQAIDKILLEITVKDEKNHKIRIKDEYEAGLNPNVFYKIPSIQQDIMETLTEKNNSIDLVSASGWEKDAPQYLKEIQVKLYQSNLPEFLVKYLKTADLESGASLIRLVLKLILLNLQVFAEDSPSLLRQKIEENYLNDDFTQILNKISMEDNLSDCKTCVENIKGLLQKLQNKTENAQSVQDLSPQKDDKKKLTAQERMAQLKQNFAQKQAAFAQNNKFLLQKSMSFGDPEEAKKEEHLVCQHCMQKLRVSGEEYGLPIYINS